MDIELRNQIIKLMDLYEDELIDQIEMFIDSNSIPIGDESSIDDKDVLMDIAWNREKIDEIRNLKDIISNV